MPIKEVAMKYFQVFIRGLPLIAYAVDFGPDFNWAINPVATDRA
jgi:hypothetical protein